MAAEGSQEKIWKTFWKVWKIQKGGRRRLKLSWKSRKVLASIEDILEVFNRGCQVSGLIV